MTKQPHFVIGLRLSKLCKWLFLAVSIKLSVLALVMWNGPVAAVPLPKQQVSQTALSTAPVDSPTAPAPAPFVTGPILLSAAPAMAAEEPAAEAGTDISMQREALLRKADELNRREADMRKLEQDLDKKLQDLQALEARLKKMLENANEVKDKKLQHLVDVYSNMKAKQAATVLETLDEKIAVKILAGMRGRQAGEILSFVNAQKAARLSEALTKMQLPFE